MNVTQKKNNNLKKKWKGIEKRERERERERKEKGRTAIAQVGLRGDHRGDGSPEPLERVWPGFTGFFYRVLPCSTTWDRVLDGFDSL